MPIAHDNHGQSPAKLNLRESYVVPCGKPQIGLQRLSYDQYTTFRFQSLKEITTGVVPIRIS